VISHIVLLLPLPQATVGRHIVTRIPVIKKTYNKILHDTVDSKFLAKFQQKITVASILDYVNQTQLLRC
jgi:hypothetical protein